MEKKVLKKSSFTLFFCRTLYYICNMKASENYIKQKQAERAGNDKYIGSKERWTAANNAYIKWLEAGKKENLNKQNNVH